MSGENLAPPSVSEMIRVTANNSVAFMEQIAEHIDKLEQTVLDLQKRIADLEGNRNDDQ
jgi:hemerythrin-like domain-containing protein